MIGDVASSARAVLVTAVTRVRSTGRRPLTTQRRACAWARRMTRPGVACILDVETTGFDGAIVEIAVVDAATGRTLLSTLVDPRLPIPVEASRIHRITDLDVAGAPTWPQVLPALTAAIGRRQVIAYKADFDRGRVVAECRRWELHPPRYTRAGRWECLMLARSTWVGSEKWLRLDGPHRALADTMAAHSLLHTMTAPTRPADAVTVSTGTPR